MIYLYSYNIYSNTSIDAHIFYKDGLIYYHNVDISYYSIDNDYKNINSEAMECGKFDYVLPDVLTTYEMDDEDDMQYVNLIDFHLSKIIFSKL